VVLVDASPEKAGVGGSTPSLATTFKVFRSGDMGHRTFLPQHLLSAPFAPKSVTYASGRFCYLGLGDGSVFDRGYNPLSETQPILSCSKA